MTCHLPDYLIDHHFCSALASCDIPVTLPFSTPHLLSRHSSSALHRPILQWHLQTTLAPTHRLTASLHCWQVKTSSKTDYSPSHRAQPSPGGRSQIRDGPMFSGNKVFGRRASPAMRLHLDSPAIPLADEQLPIVDSLYEQVRPAGCVAGWLSQHLSSFCVCVFLGIFLWLCLSQHLSVSVPVSVSISTFVCVSVSLQGW